MYMYNLMHGEGALGAQPPKRATPLLNLKQTMYNYMACNFIRAAYATYSHFIQVIQTE